MRLVTLGFASLRLGVRSPSSPLRPYNDLRRIRDSLQRAVQRCRAELEGFFMPSGRPEPFWRKQTNCYSGLWPFGMADPRGDVEVEWYGGRRQVLRVLTGMDLWTAPRLKPLPLNYLVTRDPSGTHRDGTCFCTDGELPPTEVLAHVVRCWSLDENQPALKAAIESARSPLTDGDSRPRSLMRPGRSTPMAIGWNVAS